MTLPKVIDLKATLLSLFIPLLVGSHSKVVGQLKLSNSMRKDTNNRDASMSQFKRPLLAQSSQSMR
jgi:hypothetical protein